MIRTFERLALSGAGTVVLLLCAGNPAIAQSVTPCGIALPNQFGSAHGLIPVDGGAIVYDSNQRVCWLADANLAGRPEVRAAVHLSKKNPDGSSPVLNPDGTMDYETALNWVDALNKYNGGKGWMNHNNWQLPTNPATDTTCSSQNVDNFGVQCTGSAMGNLYNVGLTETYPSSVVPFFPSIVWPFLNMQPGLYWTRDSNGGGEVTFSFNTGLGGSNTTKYNFLHVLPMTSTLLGPIPPGTGVLPYLSGPAAGKAVYDTNTGISRTLNANLPAFDNFGFTGTTTITSNVNGQTLTVPLVDRDGAVHFSAVDPSNATSGWIVAINANHYAGSSSWQLPSINDLRQLYEDIAITTGDPRLEWRFSVGPFWRLQPGFYWGCVRANDPDPKSPCDLGQSAPGGLQWSFNFDDGFEGTDLTGKQFYVLVYFPAPAK